MYYEVKVREDYRWSTARVGGMLFSKRAATPVSLAAMTNEIMDSALLDIETITEDVTPASEVNATTGAVELAEAQHVNLANVTGSGVDGRITKADVEAYINERTVS